MKQAIAEQYFIESKIVLDSKMIGKTIQQAGLRELGSLFLVQIYRNGNLISPVGPEQVIEVQDRLLFTGDIKEAPELLQQAGLALAGGSSNIQQPNLVEVILAHTSSLIGSTIKEAGFRNKFDAAVVAIKRGGDQLNKRLADIELQPGDTLVLATGSDFYKRENLKQNFYFYSQIKSFASLSNLQSLLVGGGFITVLSLAALSIIPLLKGLMILLAGLFAFKLITFAEVKRRFPYELMIVIGSALGIASVMMSTGVSEMIAGWVMSLFSAWGVMGSLIGVFLLTLLLTEIITNNASAAIGFPIALATAEILSVSPWPFIMVVAYAASASFMTPYGYQTNLMVYGPGNYKFKHYIQAGLPLTILYSLIVLALVPMFFPF